MGNCIVLHQKTIKVIKSDGKILEYRAPITVQQVLSDFSGHAIRVSHNRSLQHLLPETKLLGGQFYYLVPLPLPSPVVKKKVRFSIVEEEDVQEAVPTRIKLIISKQKLREMLQKGGVSVDDTVSHSQHQHKDVLENACNDKNCKEWKPILESIPEISC